MGPPPLTNSGSSIFKPLAEGRAWTEIQQEGWLILLGRDQTKPHPQDRPCVDLSVRYHCTRPYCTAGWTKFTGRWMRCSCGLRPVASGSVGADLFQALMALIFAPERRCLCKKSRQLGIPCAHAWARKEQSRKGLRENSAFFVLRNAGKGKGPRQAPVVAGQHPSKAPPPSPLDRLQEVGARCAGA